MTAEQEVCPKCGTAGCLEDAAALAEWEGIEGTVVGADGAVQRYPDTPGPLPPPVPHEPPGPHEPLTGS